MSAELCLGDDSFRLLSKETNDGHALQSRIDARERAREDCERRQLDWLEITSPLSKNS